MNRRGLMMGKADTFIRDKEQHFLIPQISHIPQGCAQPSYSGLEKAKKETPQTGFKEKRKSKYQR